MIWREPTNHANDCYHCLTNVSGYSKRTKSRFVYPDCSSVLRSVTHSHESIPIPTPPVTERDNDSSSAESIDFSQTSKSSASIAPMFSDEEPHLSQAADVSQLLNRNDLNDLIRIKSYRPFYWHANGLYQCFLCLCDSHDDERH